MDYNRSNTIQDLWFDIIKLGNVEHRPYCSINASPGGRIGVEKSVADVSLPSAIDRLKGQQSDLSGCESLEDQISHERPCWDAREVDGALKLGD